LESDKANSHANKLILQLNNELQHVRSQLESNKTQFSISQRNLSTLQKSYDSTKEALHKARVEVERHATALARKERQTLEAQERARKAEDDAKELGRSSRELGTRVRMVESELGDSRRAQAQAVAGYEAITSAWKKTRTHWEEEVKGLRGQLQEVVKEHRAQAQSALDKFEAAEEEWKGREGEKKGLEAVLEGLRAEREKARVQVAGVVDGLVSRLAAHEEEREGQDRKVEEVRGELQRLLRFMREGVTDPDLIRKGVLVQ
jgi:chromosome segregation ATPase